MITVCKFQDLKLIKVYKNLQLLYLMNFLEVGTIRNCEKTIVQTINSLSESLNWAEKVEYFL